MASKKNRKKGVRKLPSEKLNAKTVMELDETISASEREIEIQAKKLVSEGIAKDIVQAQEMVLRNPANSKLSAEYVAKFRQ